MSDGSAGFQTVENRIGKRSGPGQGGASGSMFRFVEIRLSRCQGSLLLPRVESGWRGGGNRRVHPIKQITVPAVPKKREKSTGPLFSLHVQDVSLSRLVRRGCWHLSETPLDALGSLPHCLWFVPSFLPATRDPNCGSPSVSPNQLGLVHVAIGGIGVFWVLRSCLHAGHRRFGACSFPLSSLERRGDTGNSLANSI